MSEKDNTPRLNSYFWNESQFEPKRTFRWQVRFDNQTFHIPPHYITSVRKPSFTIPSKRIQSIGYAVNVPQQVQFNPVEITCIDDQKNTLTDWVYYYFAYSGIPFDRDRGAQTAIDGNRAKRKTSNITISMIDHLGNEIESWILKGAWISDFKQSDLNYTEDSLATYTMVITYDFFYYSNNGFSSTDNKQKVSNRDQETPTNIENSRYKTPNIKDLEKIHGK